VFEEDEDVRVGGGHVVGQFDGVTVPLGQAEGKTVLGVHVRVVSDPLGKLGVHEGQDDG
jgi:hypothetical protein